MHPHEPYVSPKTELPELNLRSIIPGALLGMVFGASSLYLALRIGITVSASIPIAVLSITLFRILAKAFNVRPGNILENNMVQTIGSAGEGIAFAIGITMPALLILGFDMDVGRAIFVSVLGSILGIFLMIPTRRMFIVEQHGHLPFPEGTACADVLVTGEKGGMTARTVFTGFGVAFAYKFLMQGLRFWPEAPERTILEKTYPGASVGIEVSPELVGVGYIIGPRIASQMVAGGVLSSLILAPMIKFFGSMATAPIFPGTKLISAMEPGEIWKSYILYIGAGAVTTGGIMAVWKTLPMLLATLISGISDFRQNYAKNSGSSRQKKNDTLRTDRDLPAYSIVAAWALVFLAIALSPALGAGIYGALLVSVLGLVFVIVSSKIVGEVGSSNFPASGITVASLLASCLFFVLMGEGGRAYEVAALMITAIICVSVSVASATSQDLKTGYLVGATPYRQQVGMVIGSLSSAMILGPLILLFNTAGTVYSAKPENLPHPSKPVPVATLSERETPPASTESLHIWRVTEDQALEYSVPAGKYLVGDDAQIKYLVDPGINGVLKTRDDGGHVQKFVAPKARLMSLVIDGVMNGRLPWALILIGVFIAAVMELCGVSSLAFCVGVYLPLASSAPIFVGGLLRWVVDRLNPKDESESDQSPGVLLATGYIAGGAIAGIAIALLALIPGVTDTMDLSKVFEMNPSVPFTLLAIFLIAVGAGKFLRAQASP